MKHTFGFVMACSLVAALSACGGGSDSPDKQEPPAASSAPAVSSSSVASSLVSSSVSSSLSSVVSSLSSLSSVASSSSIQSVASSSVGSSQSSATIGSTLISGSVYLKDSDGESVDLDTDTVNVTLSLLNADGNVIAASSPKLIDSLASAQDKGVPFTAELSGAGAEIVVVNITTPGYSDFARRFEVSGDINVTATLNELQEISLAPTEITSISGKVLDGFNVSVTNSNGEQDIVSGDAAEISDLSVSIPQSALPSGTTSLDVQMQAFNPNDPEDAQSFPGAYEDSTGNKLLSVAFNYTDVKTDAGVSLQKIAQKTRSERLKLQKQSGKTITPLQYAKQVSQKTGKALEPVIINRKIPFESCVSLSQLGDANATQAGFQVPVYTYNPTSGLWDLLGYGTLFNEAGALVPADQKIFDCNLNTYVLEIEATNEIFLSNWWNLDYPLVFTQPVKLCANIELRDEGNKPVVGSIVFVADNDDSRSLSAETFVSDEYGRIHIEVISLDNGADVSASGQVFHASLYSASTTVPITLSTACNLSAPPVVIPVAVPELCKAQGRVVDTTGVPLANRYVIAGDFANTNQTLFPAFAVTDATGGYDLSLQCKQNYQVFDWLSAIFNGTDWQTNFVTNVNSAVEVSEVSDNGKTAVLKDLVADASKPIAYVANTENSQTQLSLLVMYGGSDFPLTYNFSLLDSNSQVVGEYSGKLVATDFTNADGDYPFPYLELVLDHNLPVATDFVAYPVSGDITNSKGDKTTILGGVYLGGTDE